MMVLFIDWLVFKIVPGYIEGAGLAVVVLSVMALSAWDLIAAKISEEWRPNNAEKV